MNLEDYQTYYQPLFSRAVKIAMAIFIIALLLIPVNTAPLEHRLYEAAVYIYQTAVDSPQELINTYVIKKLDLHFNYSETDPALILKKRQHQRWLLQKWLFWGFFFVSVLPLTLLCSIGFVRKIKTVLSRSQLSESYEGTLLWEIKDKIRRVSWRVNFFNWEKSFIHVFIIGSILFLGQFFAQFVLNLSQEMMRSLLFSFLIYTIGLYIFYLYYNRFSEKQVVGFIDTRMGLKERLLTSLEKPETSTPFYSVVLEDTSQQLRQQDADTLAPHLFPHPDKTKLGGMLFFTIVLAMLISAATPHAALLVKSYKNYIKWVDPPKKKDEVKELEKVIRKEGKKLQGLIDSLESDSDAVNFAIEESRMLAMQMTAFDIEKQNIFMDFPNPSGSNSKTIIPDNKAKKEVKLNGGFERNIMISKIPLSIRSNRSNNNHDKSLDQVIEALSQIAKQILQESKYTSDKSVKTQGKNSFLQQNVASKIQGDKDIRDDSANVDSESGNEGQGNIESAKEAFDRDDNRENEREAFKEQQEDNDSELSSVEFPSTPENVKNRFQNQEIDMQALQSLLEEIFKQEEQVQTPEEKQGTEKEEEKKQVSQNTAPEQKEESKAEENSVDELLKLMPSKSQQNNSTKNNELKSKSPSDFKQWHKAPLKKVKGKAAQMAQSREQRKVQDFSKSPPNKKNVFILDQPRNIEIAEEAYEEIPDEFATEYLEKWANDSNNASANNDLPLPDEDTERTLVLGKKADILSKALVVIKNPANIKNPRAEMRKSVASVDTPYFIKGLPKKLSHFVKDITDPKKIEVFTSQLNKLGKDLDDWERANTPRIARFRLGQNHQKAKSVEGNWVNDHVELGGHNPGSNQDATIIRGNKAERTPGPEKDRKFRIENYPEHLSPHQNLTNISQDLSKLGRELTDTEGVQRQAIMGRLETSGDSPNNDKKIDRQNLKEKLNKLGNRFEGLGNKIQQISDPAALRVLSDKMIEQSRDLGNVLLGRSGNSSPQAKQIVKNTLQKNKKKLEQLSEKIQNSPFNADNISKELTSMVSKTRSLANQPGLSESESPGSDDIIKNALRQKADSIEQLVKDMRQRSPKGKGNMAQRFSSLAKNMDNLGLGLEKGKSTGNQANIDTIKKGLQQKGKRVELLSEKIKQGKKPMGIKEMASQLSKTTEEMLTSQKKLGNATGKDKLTPKMRKIKDINRKIQQQTNAHQMQKLASQMSGMAQDFNFSLESGNIPPPQYIDQATRQQAVKLGKQFIQLSKQMQNGADIKDLKKMAKQMIGTSQKMRKMNTSPDLSTRNGKIPAQIKKAGNQLRRLAKRAQEKNLSLEKLTQEIDKSSKQLDQLLKQSKNMQQKYASQIKKATGKLSMIQEKLKGMGSVDPQKESITQKTKENILKQKTQLKKIAERIQKDPKKLSQAAKELQELSNKIKLTAAKGDKKLDTTASSIKKLAADMKKAVPKVRVSNVIKAVEKSMQETLKEMEKINLSPSGNSAKTRRQALEMAALSQEMEKLSRLKSRLEADRTASRQQKKALQNAWAQLQEISKKLQRETNPEKTRGFSQKALQISKKLASLPQNNNQEPPNQIGKQLKKMVETLKQDQNLNNARKISDNLEKIVRKLDNRTNKNDSAKQLSSAVSPDSNVRKLNRVKEKLDKLIKKIAHEQLQEKNRLRQKIKELSKQIQSGNNSADIKKYSTELDEIPRKKSDVSMNSANASGKKRLQEDGILDTTRNSGNSLQTITERLHENIDSNKLSSDLTELSEELSNIDLGGKKKTDLAENLRERNMPGRQASSSVSRGSNTLKLKRVKEKLDKLIKKVVTVQQLEKNKLSQRIQELSTKIQSTTQASKIEPLSDELSNLTNRMASIFMGGTRGPTERLNKDVKKGLSKTTKLIKQLSQKIKNRPNLEEIKNTAKELKKQVDKTAGFMLQQKGVTPGNRKAQQDIRSIMMYTQKLSRKIQSGKNAKDIKKYSTELDGLLRKISNVSMGSANASGKRRLQEESILEIIRNFGNSLQTITKRLNENIDPRKISSKLTELSEELSNLDLGGKKKADSEENISLSDKKIIKKTGDKLKELADKAKTQKNPKDIRQMASELTKLAGNLKSLDMNKVAGQGQNPNSPNLGRKRKFQGQKLKQLAAQIDKSSDVRKTQKVALQISKLVYDSGDKNHKRGRSATGTKNEDKQEKSGSLFKKILDLPSFFQKNEDLKKKKKKSTKEREKNDLTRTVAVNKIERLIKKLKRRKKKLPEAYNAKRIIKKPGISSKGAGSIKKGIVGKMSTSDYTKAKFIDSEVSKDVNILPNSNIINNTYTMEKNLTDRDVFERIIKRLEKNRESILTAGINPHQVIPVEKLPLSKDYQPRPKIPSKQPIEGDDTHMLAGIGIPAKTPGPPPLGKEPEDIPDQSYMDNMDSSQFLKMSVKQKKAYGKNLRTDRLLPVSNRYKYRLNTTLNEDDSMIDQAVPNEYKYIIRQLFSHDPESSQDSTGLDQK